MITAPPSGYEVAFDITASGYRQWTFAAAGLLFVIIGVVLVSVVSVPQRIPPDLRQRSDWFLGWPRWPPAVRRGFAWFFLGFAILWTTLAFAGTYFEYAGLVHAVRSGQVQHVEGVVENFIPMPYGGHPMESFTVQEEYFSYSDYIVTAGFNNAASHGGPIRPGRRVRIDYVGDTIVRLEVAK